MTTYLVALEVMCTFIRRVPSQPKQRIEMGQYPRYRRAGPRVIGKAVARFQFRMLAATLCRSTFFLKIWSVSRIVFWGIISSSKFSVGFSEEFSAAWQKNLWWGLWAYWVHWFVVNFGIGFGVFGWRACLVNRCMECSALFSIFFWYKRFFY
jgi:hypothetical protein